MLTLAFTRRVIAVIALLLHATLVTSCSSWKTQVKPAREVIETGKQVYGGGRRPLSSVRVHSRGEGPVIFYEPRIHGDSLLGMTRQPIATPSYWPWTSGVRWLSTVRPASIPLDSIRSVETRGFSLKKTALYCGIGLGLFVALVATSGPYAPG